MDKSENIEAYIRDIAQRLKNPRENGGASLMIGAGFSRNAISNATEHKMPLWGELANRMYSELYPMPEEGTSAWKEWEKKDKSKRQKEIF